MCPGLKEELNKCVCKHSMTLCSHSLHSAVCVSAVLLEMVKVLIQVFYLGVVISIQYQISLINI